MFFLYFIVLLKFSNHLSAEPIQVQSIFLCNNSYYFQNPFHKVNIMSIQYGVLLNNNNWGGSKSSKIQIFFFIVPPLPFSQMTIYPTVSLVSYYTRDIFYSVVSYPCYNPKIISNGSLYCISTDSKTLKTLTNTFLTVFSNFIAFIYDFIYIPNVSSVHNFFIIDNTTFNIYDEFEKMIMLPSDLQYIQNLASSSSYFKIEYDDSHQDVYLVVDNLVFIYDVLQSRIWMKFTAHQNKISDLKIIKSPDQQKFCIITTEYSNNLMLRWRPDYTHKTDYSMIYQYNKNDNYTIPSLDKIIEIVTVFNYEFLIISTYNPSVLYDTIYILYYDFSLVYSFNHSKTVPKPSYLVGKIELSDVFYVYNSEIPEHMTQYSLFADFPNCAKCVTGTNLWFYPYMGGCGKECDSFNRRNYPFCEPKCDSQTCSQLCLSNQSECGQCGSAYYEMARGFISRDCMAKLNFISIKQYIDPLNNVIDCHPSCNTCVGPSPTQCLSCPVNGIYDVETTSCISFCSNTLINVNIKQDYCLENDTCPFGKYSYYGSFNCDQTCSNLCATCYSVNDNCTSCPNDQILFNHTCYDSCPAGTYQTQDYITSLYHRVCMPCHSMCKKCIDSADFCLSCPSGYQLTTDNRCDDTLTCNVGFYYNNDMSACKSCNLTCGQCHNTMNNCTVCSNPSNFIVYNEAFDEYTCNSSCGVGNGYYVDDSGISKYCYHCLANCNSCNNSKICLNCSKGYLTTTNGSCLSCNASCMSCQHDNANNCTSCVNSSFYYDKTTGFCMEKCNPNSYISDVFNKICDLCNGSNCLTCDSNANNCTSCQTSHYLFKNQVNNQCVSSCPDGYFVNNSSECLICNATCLNCSINANNCSGCLLELLYLNTTGFCYNTCPYPGTFQLNSKLCIDCNKSICESCDKNPNNCTSCIDKSLSLYNNTCMSCPNATYFNNGICNDCPVHCQKCMNSSYCLICQANYFLKSNLCVSDCNIGYLNVTTILDGSISSICDKCGPNCLSCAYDKYNCSTCKLQNYLIDLLNNSKTCMSNCSDPGYYIHIDENTNIKYCSQCGSNCFSCNSSTYCHICNKGFQLNADNICIMNSSISIINNTNISSCLMKQFLNDKNQCQNCSDISCFNCSINDTCIECQSPYLLNATTCVQNCYQHEYYSPSHKLCLACHNVCLTCFGPESNNCISCQNPYFYLKGTVCVSRCKDSVSCDIPSNNLTITLEKSEFEPNIFFLVFSQAVQIADYMNLDQLINITLLGVDPKTYTYTVQKVSDKDNTLLIDIITQASIKSPIVYFNFTSISQTYIRDQYNNSFSFNNNSNTTLTLDSILIPNEQSDVITMKKQMTYESFISLSYLLLSLCAITYVIESIRMSIFWNLTDFMQLVSLILFINFNYNETFINFLTTLFQYHASFICFYGKTINGKTGEITYFGNALYKNYKSDDQINIFLKYLGSSCFIVNGFNAFFVILMINSLMILMKIIIIIIEKLWVDREASGFYGVFKYIYNNMMFSLLIITFNFFFYIIILSILVQFLTPNLDDRFNKLGLGISVVALLYFLIFFIWLSRNVINNSKIYESEEERYVYDSVFHDLQTKNFLQRNHFIFNQIKKCVICFMLTYLIYTPKQFITGLLVIQIISTLKHVVLRPYKSFKMNFLMFFTEICLLAIICVLFKVNAITEEQQNGSLIISKDSIELMTQVGDGIISICFVVLGFYVLISFILFIFYAVKNADCLCFFLSPKKTHEEIVNEQIEINDVENESDASTSKFKIPHKRDMREIVREEQEKQKKIEAYKKKHIVQIG